MTTLLIKNAKLQGQEGLKQILIENGQFSRILDNDAQINHQGETLDAQGNGKNRTTGSPSTVTTTTCDFRVFGQGQAMFIGRRRL